MVDVAEHPAKFSDPILRCAVDVLEPYVRRGRVHSLLDPFAGTGRCHAVADELMARTSRPLVSIGLEIQPRWACAEQRTLVANVLELNRPMQFDCVFTSPCYGNRMADSHNARDDSKRHTYTHYYGEPLHPQNAGLLQWGPKYRRFHRAALVRVVDSLRWRGLFVLNISDHLRKVDGVQQRMPVSRWYLDLLSELGCVLVNRYDIPTSRQRNGANGDARVEAEHVLVFDKRRRS